jgi:hypothetical protein
MCVICEVRDRDTKARVNSSHNLLKRVIKRPENYICLI